MNSKKIFIRFFILFLNTFILGSTRCEDNCDEALKLRFTSNVASFRKVNVPLETVERKIGATRDIEVIEFQTLGEQRFSEKDLFNEPADLIVGIDVMGNTQGHTYLVIDGIRIDGRMFFAPQTEIKEGWTISNGLIIRYKNLPKANKDALKAWLETPTVLRTPTCVAAACQILYDIGRFENPPPKKYWFPSRLLRHLARNGLTGDDGSRILPEIYTVNRDVYKVWSNLPDWKSVPFFIFKVLFDPYTWAGAKRDGLANGKK